MNASPILIGLYGGPHDGTKAWLTRAEDRYYPSAWPELLHHYHREAQGEDGDLLVYKGVVDR